MAFLQLRRDSRPPHRLWRVAPPQTHHYAMRRTSPGQCVENLAKSDLVLSLKNGMNIFSSNNRQLKTDKACKTNKSIVFKLQPAKLLLKHWLKAWSRYLVQQASVRNLTSRRLFACLDDFCLKAWYFDNFYLQIFVIKCLLSSQNPNVLLEYLYVCSKFQHLY